MRHHQSVWRGPPTATLAGSSMRQQPLALDFQTCSDRLETKECQEAESLKRINSWTCSNATFAFQWWWRTEVGAEVCEIFMSYKSYKQEQVQPVECFMTLQGIRFPTSMGWHSPEFTSLFNFSYMQVCCGSLNDGLFSERYTSRQHHEKPEQAGCHASFHCNYFRLHYRDKNHNQEHQNHRPMSIWFCSKFVTGLQHGRSSNGNLCPLVEMSGVFWRELSDRLGTRESTFLGTGRHPIKAIVPLILGNVPGTPLWATFSVVRIVRFAAVTLMLPVWWNSSLSYEGFWRVLPLTGFCGRGCFCCYPLLGCCWRSWSGWWWWWWFVISCRDFATALYVY